MAMVAAPSPVRPAVYRFEGFTLDLLVGVLIDPHGTELHVRPKTFFLLRHLVENAGRLVSRDELLAAVWPGIFVTDDSITLCIGELRRVLSDDGRRLIRTTPRRGYMLAATVTRDDCVTPPPVAADPVSAAPVAMAVAEDAGPVAGAVVTGPPVLAVQPFVNMTNDPEQDYFADGITEDLTTLLSHLRCFSVVARNSAFTYKGNAVDVREVGRRLGADYVLEGSVRKAGDKVRITAQLCAADTGRHVWADRFDGTLADIFAFQDRVTEAVVGGIEPSLRFAELERIRARPTASQTAYDLYLRAMARRYVSREGSDEAQALLRQAIRLDPNYVVAHGALAITHTYRFAQGWSKPGDTEEALRYARRVVEVGGHEPSTLANAAHALAYLGRDYDAALAAAQRALLLAPNAAQILLACGWMRAYVGEAEAALALIERAKQLSPADPLTFIFNSAASYAHFVAGRYEQAVHAARRALSEGPTYLVALRLLATSLAHAGRVEEAAEAARTLLSLAPGYTLAAAADHASMRDPVTRRRFVDGLRLAGVPD
ncbi:winged helix-turn-helix domain-containing tetratricopeptide repeat protein [Acidisphaera rubrifaciens]|nr:winged helix-turn-helix domain-containing tetratricopeptide repeat protein [Acidisphaera rubrifaciens]